MPQSSTKRLHDRQDPFIGKMEQDGRANPRAHDSLGRDTGTAEPDARRYDAQRNSMGKTDRE